MKVTTACSVGLAAHAAAFGTLAASVHAERVTTRVVALVGVQIVEHHTSTWATPSILVRSEIVPLVGVQQGVGGLALSVWPVASMGL